MTTTTTHHLTPAEHRALEAATTERVTLGFWIYIMSDCLIFGSLFATYAVLRDSTFGGPGARELFSLNFVLLETVILLTSSYTSGLGILSARAGQTGRTIFWFLVTFAFGVAFVSLEFSEFRHLVLEGHDWSKSAFLSAYFALVGTHGLHVTIGSFWMFVLILTVMVRGLNARTTRQLITLSLFWHFLDIVWIFIFTFVYLMGLM